VRIKTLIKNKIMSSQYTFSMLKPDALKRNITGLVNAYLEEAGLAIVAQKMINLTRQQVQEFYAEHKERPFFNDLVANMADSVVVVQVLKGENAIELNREIMGVTDPDKAGEGTIRGDLGESIDKNTIHGSDSPQSAKREIEFFFKKEEILG
jgi:nucleoside-diphosphate kinase